MHNIMHTLTQTLLIPRSLDFNNVCNIVSMLQNCKNHVWYSFFAIISSVTVYAQADCRIITYAWCWCSGTGTPW